MLKKTVSAFACAVLAAAALQAAPLDPNDVSAKAKWVVHADVEQIVKGKIGGKAVGLFLSQAAAGPRGRNPVAVLDTRYGFNLLRDVKGVTVYGTSPFNPEANDAPADIAAVFHATFDAAKLQAASAALPEYRPEKHNGHALAPLCLPDPSEKCQLAVAGPCWACFEKGRFVIGSSKEAVAAALDVLDGKAPALKTGTPESEWLGKPGAAPLFAAATDMHIQLPDETAADGTTGEASAVERFHLTVGETAAKDGDALRGAAALRITSVAGARMMQRELQKGLAELSSEMDKEEERLDTRPAGEDDIRSAFRPTKKDLAFFRQVLAGVSFSVDQQTFKIKLDVPVTAVQGALEFFERMAKEFQHDLGDMEDAEPPPPEPAKPVAPAGPPVMKSLDKDGMEK
jgi:hypothetical protein